MPRILANLANADKVRGGAEFAQGAGAGHALFEARDDRGDRGGGAP